jgi:DNA modification methylase
MAKKEQPKLFDIAIEKTSMSGNSEWGTFRDSLKAPIHGWFTYPAGFSQKAVEHFIDVHNLKPGKNVLFDPFMGSGTTNIVAKLQGIDSLGVEAHPFVFEITKSKMDWDVDTKKAESIASQFERFSKIPSLSTLNKSNNEKFPELLHKCFLPNSLFILGEIRDFLNETTMPKNVRRLLQTALICSLRDVSIAATGWPYIAPKKTKITSMSKDPIVTLQKRVLKMLGDVQWARENSHERESNHECVLGDSRKVSFPDNSATHIFTSPPYLNNFDYADRTRLEMYFMGEANNWGDISTKIRTKLMTSATTQISRANPRYILNPRFSEIDSELNEFLAESIGTLGDLRTTKGGKKSYDLMVAGYFNDMLEIVSECARVLRSGGKASFVLGDSAPYGVHIPTDELIGRIAVGVGFKKYQIEQLRVRGEKWANNPQRHGIGLRESIVHLTN